MTIPSRNHHNPIEDHPSKLDAFGHLNWTVNSLEDQPDDGEWMACFDAIYNQETGMVDYQVVVDAEFFTDTAEQGSVAPADIDGLRSLPERWHSIGIEQGLLMDDEALKATNERWNAWLNEIKESIPQGQFDKVSTEQSLDYFDRYIAGDR